MSALLELGSVLSFLWIDSRDRGGFASFHRVLIRRLDPPSHFGRFWGLGVRASSVHFKSRSEILIRPGRYTGAMLGMRLGAGSTLFQRDHVRWSFCQLCYGLQSQGRCIPGLEVGDRLKSLLRVKRADMTLVQDSICQLCLHGLHIPDQEVGEHFNAISNRSRE